MKAEPKQKLFAFGVNVSGTIAIGVNVRGVVALGVNALGSVVAIGLNAGAPIAFGAVNAVGIVAVAGVNALGAWALGTVLHMGSPIFAIGGSLVWLVVAMVLREKKRARPSTIDAPEPPPWMPLGAVRDQPDVWTLVTAAPPSADGSLSIRDADTERLVQGNGVMFPTDRRFYVRLRGRVRPVASEDYRHVETAMEYEAIEVQPFVEPPAPAARWGLVPWSQWNTQVLVAAMLALAMTGVSFALR